MNIPPKNPRAGARIELFGINILYVNITVFYIYSINTLRLLKRGSYSMQSFEVDPFFLEGLQMKVESKQLKYFYHKVQNKKNSESL